ncbi:LacI family DNA-binding transcriptional regulator [Olivibacter domesticus]|uniref:Transcriptional regulator, LacI family n=1 Tax=Olivibacter domesticus TaxID=407022 RepID=A0A1H7LB98_OLID1|nr:LacI family DNA-binding transcriptional regulator [Olivibacter domesticus]SEK96148.1 transcriptional regulator, LacI family [Olivibacter domesticus]
MSQVNIKKLAAALGLSTSTVSRAFRNNNDINPQTKERILQMAETLGYSPNIYASNLRESKSKTIAIIIPEFGNNFFSQAIKGIEQQARANGYHTLIYVTEDDVNQEAAFVRALCNGRVEGVVMSASGEGLKHSHLSMLKEKKVPLVFFDRCYEDVDATCVTGNDYDSSYAATRHLIENGCKRIVYLVVNKKISIGKIRMQGYRDALKDAGVPYDETFVIECTNDKDEIYATLKDAMNRLKPDGAFASVERLAMASLRLCQNEGINIPEDFKLICFSCLEIADMLNPPLSTVKQPAFEMGEKAAEVLFEALSRREVITKKQLIYLPSIIIPRKSTTFINR